MVCFKGQYISWLFPQCGMFPYRLFPQCGMFVRVNIYHGCSTVWYVSKGTIYIMVVPTYMFHWGTTMFPQCGMFLEGPTVWYVSIGTIYIMVVPTVGMFL